MQMAFESNAICIAFNSFQNVDSQFAKYAYLVSWKFILDELKHAMKKGGPVIVQIKKRYNRLHEINSINFVWCLLWAGVIFNKAVMAQTKKSMIR